ncbi:MAG: SGNH/GDSL hydrolase family protein [Deltaproteobacteria bacterium]|nr:SGNH/GDSL hydrolase family protein [Deltaproteobacteria bacterium]
MSFFAKNRFTSVLRYFLIVLVTLIGIEMVLRAFMPFYFVDNRGVYQYDSELQIVPRKNLHLVRLKDYQEEYVTNKFGTVNYQNDFKKYQYLVFAIGDSYTQGIGLPPDASYPFQLDLLLNLEGNEYKSKYGIVNLGLGGYGGEQYLLSLKRYIKVFGKPDFILVLGCHNDYEDDLRFKAFQSGKTINLIEGNPKFAWFFKPLAFLGYDTEIGKRVLYAIKNIQMGSFIRNDLKKSGPKKNDPALPPEVKCPAEREVHIYEEFNKIAQELNAKLIISWANRDESYPWLKNWAQSQKISFVDWQPTMDSVRQNFFVPEGNFHSGGHYRTWVNGIIARGFARNIRNFSPADRQPK